MGKALYRKYRSKKLAEIVGQKHITDTLEKAIKQGAISHAYLFSGPRGVGKTSVARILAHTINDLKYDEDEPSHLDIIEIDAASNRRIDEIRDINERVRTAPTSAKYKVYIIDEVHMLTREAFNALLKTLEEPPEHAVFILATTEAHKLPSTIISRTQRFSFKPIDDQLLQTQLRLIADKENIQITDKALSLIAKHADGSFRDGLSLLDQIRHSGTKIDSKEVMSALGYAPEDALDKLLASLTNSSLKDLSDVLESLYDQGIGATHLAVQISDRLRSDILEDDSPLPKNQVLNLLGDLLKVASSRDPKLSLEMSLFSVAVSKQTTVPDANIKPLPPTPKIVTEPKGEVKSKPSNTNLWVQVLGELKGRHNTLYGIARMADPELVDNKLVLKFAFAFHQKRLDDSKNKQILLTIINKLTDKKLIVETMVDKNTSPKEKSLPPTIAETSTSHVKAISNIFGGAEVLE